MKLNLLVVHAIVPLLLGLRAAEGAPGPTKVVFVEKGVPKLVREAGKPWKRGKGYLEGTGRGNDLFGTKGVDAGDFHITARLTILNLKRSAAAFKIGEGYFGFEGANGQIFTSGRLFGKLRALGKPDRFLKAGRPFTFEVTREGKDLTFLIDGKRAHGIRLDAEALGPVGFVPTRSTMRISAFAMTGNAMDIKPPPPRTQPDYYTVPIVDVSNETHRQVIIDKEPGQYLGHPSTVMLPDNKTIYVAYPKGHGRGAIVLKRSDDGGRTWSDRLGIPDNWSTSLEVPTLFRMIDPKGKARLILFSGLYPARRAISEDDGKTWTPLEPVGDWGGIVVMGECVRLKDGRYLAMFHDDGRFFTKNGRRKTFKLYQSISADGGVTWSTPRVVGEHPAAHPCEPGIVRSPDGKQLAVLLRENSRKYNSFLMVSNDEAETWSDLIELPAALTGDRHVIRYAPDGRLVMSFRDTTLESPTRGNFVLWVGTYDDIIHLRQGQYRVLLLRHYGRPGDCGYAGLELLPDGTFVSTTYVVHKPGEKNSVVSVRFKLAEFDEKVARQKLAQTDVYVSGKEGYHTFRIPAVLTTKQGTLLAFCEGRKNSRRDDGDIDLLLKRSFDGGKTWQRTQLVHEEGGGAEITIGNPCPVLDRATGKIHLLFCRNNQRAFYTCSDDDGATWAGPVEITEVFRGFDFDWTRLATGPGHGIQLQAGPHKGRLIVPAWLNEGLGKGYRAAAIISDDGARTWRAGGLIGPAVENTNECMAVETAGHTVCLNIRARGSKQRSVAWSRDGGATWTAPKPVTPLIGPTCQASIVRLTGGPAGGDSRVLFANPASKKRERMTVRISTDEAKTWSAGKLLHRGPSAYSDLCVLPDQTVGCLYERGEKHPYEKITFARFNLEWLTDSADQLGAR